MKTIVFLTICLATMSYANSCSPNRETDPYSKEKHFIADYGSFHFEKWKGWTVSYRDGAGYYLACYVQDTIMDKVIFKKTEHIEVLMQSRFEKADKFYSLHDISLSSLWKRFYSIADYESFCQVALFVADHDYQKLLVTDDEVIVQGQDFEVRKSLSKEMIIDTNRFIPISDIWYVKQHEYQ